MNARKLDHVSFLVKDVERSRRFYGEVLGLREIPRPRGDGVQQIFICDPDDYMIELFVSFSPLKRGKKTHGQPPLH